MTVTFEFGRQTCGDLEAAASREWLVTDGLGGFAMGTVAGLRTRRYHGLLVVAGGRPGVRKLGLAALDPVLVVGERRLRLAVNEWTGGVIDPMGHKHIATFALDDGIPRWQYAVGDVLLEREVAMLHGRPAVAVVHRLRRASQPVRLELAALCTWRNVHGETVGVGGPTIEQVSGGFVFEHAYRVAGPGFEPSGEWFRGFRYRVEAERGLADEDDLWHAGTFVSELRPGQSLAVTAWAGDLDDGPPVAEEIVAQARVRARLIAAQCHPADVVDEALALAADQFVVEGPTIVAGYPWFGEWSRDTMTSYEGLLLETGRHEEGRRLLTRSAGTLSEGMLANTTDVGGTEYNGADATLWFLNAVGRHAAVTGDLELAADLAESLLEVVERHIAGTRFGIMVDASDGLLSQGEEGYALTWMDARVDGRPVTQRAGKAVEINALWINGLATVAALFERLGKEVSLIRRLEALARSSFRTRFWDENVCLDVVDSSTGNSRQLRPNCLLAVSLPYAPLAERRVVEASGHKLLTSLGLRSLSPDDPRYVGRHRGGPADRDGAYHQGTVWPWLIGPYVEGAMRAGVETPGVLDGLLAHLNDWGLGSVSETADGDPPHAATGCPFQAWSVAEVLRARRLLATGPKSEQ
ncbi:MAG TPA: amylo-alpha-1,6-glucosidase [Candidatus Micrarchaeaceae archaeon]|nr:amylo-alpha-1,6-glucosidase [Candidatus Micrarchaeaceae archaeon]